MNAARDMDRLRAALGDKKLNYFGISYGTQLGAIYATKFPKNVGRMVLDGTLDPSATLEQRTLAQTTGFQHAYDSFLKDCVKEAGQCEIGSRRDHRRQERREAPGRPEGQADQGRQPHPHPGTGQHRHRRRPVLRADLAAAGPGRSARGSRATGGSCWPWPTTTTAASPTARYTTLMSSFPAISCVDTAERPDQGGAGQRPRPRR